MSDRPRISEPSSPTPVAPVAGGLILVGSLAVGGVGAMNWPAAFWPGYLVACVFWTSVSLGGLGIGLLHPLTGGRWGWGMGRELHATIGTLALIILAVLPLIAGARWVFPWAMESPALNPHQRQYLAPQWVLIRTAASWVAWSGLGLWLIRAYSATARNPVFCASPRLAAVGLILFWITVTSAAVDGLMSLDPSWSSSLFGAIEVLGCAVAGLAWVLLIRGLGSQAVDEEQAQLAHDLGNLLMAFNLLWVYLAFSQYLISWAGDLPHEVAWYAARQRGTPGLVGGVLLAGHFAVPFAWLLSIANKRNPRRLAMAAGLLLVMRAVDAGWTIFPACPAANAWSVVAAVASCCGLGVIWTSSFAWLWRRMPAVDLELMAKEEAVATAEAMEPAR